MNISKINYHVKEVLHERGFTEQEISIMTPEQAFCEYCRWHGLISWGATLINVLDSLRKAEKE